LGLQTPFVAGATRGFVLTVGWLITDEKLAGHTALRTMGDGRAIVLTTLTTYTKVHNFNVKFKKNQTLPPKAPYWEGYCTLP